MLMMIITTTPTTTTTTTTTIQLGGGGVGGGGRSRIGHYVPSVAAFARLQVPADPSLPTDPPDASTKSAWPACRLKTRMGDFLFRRNLFPVAKTVKTYWPPSWWGGSSPGTPPPSRPSALRASSCGPSGLAATLPWEWPAYKLFKVGRSADPYLPLAQEEQRRPKIDLKVFRVTNNLWTGFEVKDHISIRQKLQRD